VRVTVIGAGSWGTAMSSLVAAKGPVSLWARRPVLAAAIDEQRRNPAYLPEVRLPAAVHATSDLSTALDGADVVVMAVPSHGFRAVLEQAAGFVAPEVPIVSLTKGIEQDTLLRMTEVVAAVLPGHSPDRVGVLTGPNLAAEVAAGQPTAAVVALGDAATAARLQELFMTPAFRVYTNDDVVGCEAAGALKNVMAIAAGMAHGLGLGDNTMATLITRALAEITRVGVVLGGRPLTFSGLAGMGDLIATCVSTKSRNHRVGFGLGSGRTLDDVVGEMHMVAEGVKSTRAILALARRHGIEMPIAEQVGKVLYEQGDPVTAVATLMGRRARRELHGID